MAFVVLFCRYVAKARGGIFKRNVDLVYRIITPTTHTKFYFLPAKSGKIHALGGGSNFTPGYSTTGYNRGGIFL